MRSLLLSLLLIPASASAQWTLQSSGTTADLRGIHSLGNGIAWASGSNGTILHSIDNGATWLPCAIPPDAEHLDFRAIQAFDASTAIVMSSGKGDLSRLYKTTDACQTWTLMLTNQEPEGRWDAIATQFRQIAPNAYCQSACITIVGQILGDPVRGRIQLLDFDVTGFYSPPSLQPWPQKVPAMKDETAFAASNSVYLSDQCASWIATGGQSGSRIIKHTAGFTRWDNGFDKFEPVVLPLGQHTASSGTFSIALRLQPNAPGNGRCEMGALVAVGGDNLKPEEPTGNAAFTVDDGKHWITSTTPPHGFRSAVAYNPATKSWITVGPNGTDISTDDGRNWRPLKPQPGEASDSDRNWNALSLPFVVGPHGRIGILNASP